MSLQWNISGLRIVGRGLFALAAAVAALGVVGAPALAQDASLPTKNITLTLNNAPVKSALEILFKSAGLNYSIDSTIAGFVTVDLHNVPFDSALRTVLRSVTPALTYTTDGGVYNIKAKGTDTTPTQNPNQLPAGQAQPQQPDNGTPGATPGATSGNPVGLLTPGSFEVIKINYADAGIIASVFGPLPGQTPNIIVPATTLLTGGGGGGGFGGQTQGQGGFGGQMGQGSSGFGGSSSGFGGTTSGFGGSSSGYGGSTGGFGGRGF